MTANPPKFTPAKLDDTKKKPPRLPPPVLLKMIQKKREKLQPQRKMLKRGMKKPMK